MKLYQDIFKSLKNHQYKQVLDYLNQTNQLDPNFRVHGGNYLIQLSIIMNRYSIVKRLLELNCRIDVLDADQRTILYPCVKHNYLDIMKIILEYDEKRTGIPLFDVNDKYGKNVMHYIIEFGTLDCFKLAIEFQPNKLRDSSQLFLFIALNNRVDIIKFCIGNNIPFDVNVMNRNNDNALHISAHRNDTVMSQILLKEGIDPNKINKKHHLSIFDTIHNNNFILFEKIFSKLKNINQADHKGRTILHQCIGKREFMQHLLDNNEKLNYDAQDIDGYTPLHLLLKTSNINPDKTMIGKLIKFTKLNIQDYTGSTVLHYLFSKNWQHYSGILEKKKCNILIENYDSKAPIDMVSVSNMELFVETMIRSYQYTYRTKKYSTVGNDELRHKIVSKTVIFPRKTPFSPKLYVRPNKAIFISGLSIDILMNLLHIKQLKKNTGVILNAHDLISNPRMESKFSNLGFEVSISELINFQIMWIYQELIFPTWFEQELKTMHTQHNLLIAPLGIINGKGQHANIIIIDTNKKTVERFEPYGASGSIDYYYNFEKLDRLLKEYFNTLQFSYIPPRDFLPNIGFQAIENMESSSLYDPCGFCSIWCYWYAELRIRYPNFTAKKLVKKLNQHIVFYNIGYKNVIRSHALVLVEFRDKMLKKIGQNIDQWVSSEVSESMIEKLSRLF